MDDILLYYINKHKRQAEVTEMYEEFVRDRITQLRLQKGVSEYKMSYDLGHSRGYVYNISSGKSLPPLTELFAICDYFGITPSEFFDDNISRPELLQKALEGLKQLDENDLQLILNFIDRLLGDVSSDVQRGMLRGEGNTRCCNGHEKE